MKCWFSFVKMFSKCEWLRANTDTQCPRCDVCQDIELEIVTEPQQTNREMNYNLYDGSRADQTF